VKRYYDERAPEYDEWYLGQGLFAARERPGWETALERLIAAVAALPPARTLDLACGTGFLTRHLRGPVIGLDQSERMIARAREQAPGADFLIGDALAAPFAHDTFDRVVTGHFYGHLQPAEQEVFIAQARQLAPELIVVDSALRPDHAPAEWQERTLNDGSRHQVFKRYFDAATLLAELGGGTVIEENDWFVMVSSPRPMDPERPR
jgi:demethylmenaquinone methyltransferase/2-methoxy-6-polyprenyl-1,4-benzoquinol methylase